MLPLEIYRNPYLAEAMISLNMINTQGGTIVLGVAEKPAGLVWRACQTPRSCAPCWGAIERPPQSQQQSAAR